MASDRDRLWEEGGDGLKIGEPLRLTEGYERQTWHIELPSADAWVSEVAMPSKTASSKPR